MELCENNRPNGQGREGTRVNEKIGKEGQKDGKTKTEKREYDFHDDEYDT